LGGATVKIAFDGVVLPERLLYIIVAASGLIMTSTAYWGIKALSVISIIAVPSIAVLGCYSAYCAMFVDEVPAVVEAGAANGWELMKSFTPDSTKQLTIAAAISIAIGSFISGGSCTPDFARFSRSPKIAVSTTALAFFIGNSLMFFFGAAGAMVWGISDISLVLKAQGLLGAAIIVLGLNIWTTNDNALYTSGLGLSNITKLPKKYMVLINGIIGTVAAVWLYDNFCGWLNILNTFLPPVGALIITDFFIVNRGKYKPYGDHAFAKVNVSAVIAWALGSLVGLLGFGYVTIPGLSNVCKMGLPAINAMATTLVVYLIAKAIKKAMCK
jgi:cytosine permease